MRHVGVQALLVACGLLVQLSASGQSGIGFRMQGQFSQVQRGGEAGVVGGYYSTLVVGPFYADHRTNGGYELGLNLVIKEQQDGFNLPVVMRDFDGGQNTGLTALELEARVGPRFGWLHPQIGALVGYRLSTAGFLQPTEGGAVELNDVYWDLPIGATVHLPTAFGTVGASVHYTIGLLNFSKNPGGQTDWQGGLNVGWRVGVHILFGEPEARKPR